MKSREMMTVAHGQKDQESDIYHALQAMLIPYHRVDVSIAKAVKEQK